MIMGRQLWRRPLFLPSAAAIAIILLTVSTVQQRNAVAYAQNDTTVPTAGDPNPVIIADSTVAAQNETNATTTVNPDTGIIPSDNTTETAETAAATGEEVFSCTPEVYVGASNFTTSITYEQESNSTAGAAAGTSAADTETGGLGRRLKFNGRHLVQTSAPTACSAAVCGSADVVVRNLQELAGGSTVDLAANLAARSAVVTRLANLLIDGMGLSASLEGRPCDTFEINQANHPTFGTSDAQMAAGYVKLDTTHAFTTQTTPDGTVFGRTAIVLTTGSAILPAATSNTADDTGASSSVKAGRLCFRLARKAGVTGPISGINLVFILASEEYPGTGSRNLNFDTFKTSVFVGTTAGTRSGEERSYNTPTSYSGPVLPNGSVQLGPSTDSSSATFKANTYVPPPGRSTYNTAYDGFAILPRVSRSLDADGAYVEVQILIAEPHPNNDGNLDSAILIKSGALPEPTAKISIDNTEITEGSYQVPASFCSLAGAPFVLSSVLSTNLKATGGVQWVVEPSSSNSGTLQTTTTCPDASGQYGDSCQQTLGLIFSGPSSASNAGHYKGFPGLARLQPGTSAIYKVTLNTFGDFGLTASKSIQLTLPACNNIPSIISQPTAFATGTQISTAANGNQIIPCNTAIAGVSVFARDIVDNDPLTYTWLVNNTAEPPSTDFLRPFNNFGTAAGLRERSTTTVQVVVSDLWGGSVTSSVLTLEVGECNDPPVASMTISAGTCPAALGPTCYLPVGDSCLITLDGSTSSDPDADDALTYKWDLLDPVTNEVVFTPPQPDASNPVTHLTVASSAASASITTVAPGTYTLRLTVTDSDLGRRLNMLSSSATQSITLPRCNTVPKIQGANKGVPPFKDCPDATGFQLDSSEFTDAENDPFTVTWRIYSASSDLSTPLLTLNKGVGDADPTIITKRADEIAGSAQPALTAGSYKVNITVQETAASTPQPLSNSEWADMVVNTCNLPPSGELGEPAVRSCNEAVLFDAQNIKDPENPNDPTALTLSWRVTKADTPGFEATFGNTQQPGFVPYGPDATVPNVVNAAGEFTVDPSGSYTVEVTASDGKESITRSKTFVVPPPCNMAPVASLIAPTSEAKCPSEKLADYVTLDDSGSSDFETTKGKAGAKIAAYHWKISSTVLPVPKEFTRVEPQEPLPVGMDPTTRTLSPYFPYSGTYYIELTVTDEKGKTSTASPATIVVGKCNEVPIPVLDATRSQAACTGTTILDSSGSSDTEDDAAQKPLARKWTIEHKAPRATDPDTVELGDAADDFVLTLLNYNGNSGGALPNGYNGALRGEGAYKAQLVVTDSNKQWAQAFIDFSVGSCNRAPTARITGVPAPVPAAPGNFIVSSASSTDPDGDSLAASWVLKPDAVDSTALQTGTGDTFTVQAPKGGKYILSLTVSDGKGGTDTATESLTLPPARLDCTTAKASPDKVWPPSHVQLMSISVVGVSDPEEGEVTIEYTGVSQTEGLKSGPGKFCPDAQITPNKRGVRVAPERPGNSKGRIYKINFTATRKSPPDTCSGYVLVCAPHNVKEDCSTDILPTKMTPTLPFDSCVCKP